MTDLPRPCRFVVSACLAGLNCRYDGRTNLKPEVAELVASGLAVPVCPEELGGLPTPRTPSERRGDSVVMADGRDVTSEFSAGAEAALYIAEEYGCCAAILKARSPSCGCGRIYDGTFSRTLMDGNGLFAELLLNKGFEVFTEETWPGLSPDEKADLRACASAATPDVSAAPVASPDTHVASLSAAPDAPAGLFATATAATPAAPAADPESPAPHATPTAPARSEMPTAHARPTALDAPVASDVPAAPTAPSFDAPAASPSSPAASTSDSALLDRLSPDISPTSDPPFGE